MPCLYPFKLKVEDSISGLPVVYTVPCGHCEQCLKKKQSDWIARLYVESQMSLSAFFVTLTYDETHLPFPQGVNKDDVQRFFKRFRKKISIPLKYFLVSEYGSISSRPHYHCLFFFRTRVDWVVLSNLIEDSWTLGTHKIGTVDLASISYCAKYCLKSRKDPRHIFDNKTFALMSKRPAIGIDLLTFSNDFQNSEIFEVVSGTQVVAMPRYYRDRIFDDVQKQEHFAKMQEKYANQKTSLTEQDKYFRYEKWLRKQKQL